MKPIGENITEVNYETMPTFKDGDHILTYAEEGFSPLTIHCRFFKIPKSVEKSFVNEVNSRNEIGTLTPPCTYQRHTTPYHQRTKLSARTGRYD